MTAENSKCCALTATGGLTILSLEFIDIPRQKKAPPIFVKWAGQVLFSLYRVST